MSRRRRFLVGGLIILAALGYLIYGGMQEAMVYFKTPSELRSGSPPSEQQFLRVGGMVVAGSLQKDLSTLTYRFQLTDGTHAIPVFFRGVPPDLFAEGKGAVIEGRMTSDGVFHATTIMAKHAEEYSPPVEGHPPRAMSFVPAPEEKSR
ncbi:MAG TPA: cytochrome c maturation protein CcmE [Candidatus Acidoferrales bacterium]|nr:cytochrome c maturation protein CcmE [Candidatus Acidoferrales bacterium]